MASLARFSTTVARRMPSTGAMAWRSVAAVQPQNFVTSAWNNAAVSRRWMSAEPDMFCYQCEQTEKGTGCTTIGVCGKTPETAHLQDLLVHAIKGLAMYSTAARAAGAAENAEVNSFFLKGIFSTLTNVNFDADRFVKFIKTCVELRDERKAAYKAAAGADFKEIDNAAAAFNPASFEKDALEAEGKTVGPLVAKAEHGDDIAGLRELVTYGIKGAAAYACHAMEVDSSADSTHATLQEVLATVETTTDAESLLGLALKVGEANIGSLQLLDAGHTTRYGDPVPTPVNHAPTAGKCVLISGHDLRDLESLLQQTEGTGVNVYTHGEMLPAHGYPGLKEKYPHLVGNYGGPWQLQRFDFSKFPGPIVITTNCLSEPRPAYHDRIYTCGVTGWPGVTHIEDRDFSAVVSQAQAMDGFDKTAPPKEVLTGFGHKAVLGAAPAVIQAVTEGKLKQLVLIGGCDGSEGERNYFSRLGTSLPDESIILTLGCGKFRLLHRKDWGTVPGTDLPRLLDMGQCNDSYSAVVVALELAKALNTDVNSLPLSISLSWFEQKAVAVLLSLLHLGVQGIHIGPNLPAFITPPVLGQLVDAFGLVAVNDPKAAAGDAAKFMEHNN